METFLLDKRYKYILKMIKELSKTASKELSIIELHNKLDISKKTIKSYFEVLQRYCQDRELETFTLENGKVKMSQNTNFNIYEFYNYCSQDSVKYQIMLSILNNPQITFTNLYLDLAISKSNCSHHIKQLNDLFTAYNCKLNFSNANPIQGDHHQIRFLFYNLFWGIDQDKIIIDSSSLDAVSHFLLDIIPTMTYTTLSKIRLAFYIFQVASKYGVYVDPEVDFTIQDSPFITYDNFFKKIDELDFLEYCPDLATKQTESRYLYFLFCRHNLLTLDDSERLSDKIAYTNDPNVQYLMTTFEEHFQITLSDPEVRCLSTNLSLFFKESSVFHGRAKTFALERLVNIFNNTNEQSATSINIFLEEVYENNQAIMSLVQNFPSLHPYCMMTLRVIIAKHMTPIKLLVQSSISTLHQEAIVSQIRNSTPFPITIYSFNQLNGEKPDGIISNWLPDKKLSDVPFFSISYFFTEWNKADLSNFLNQLATKKMIRTTENREQRTENREQRTENREQRTENREQRTENREQRTENREQRTEPLKQSRKRKSR
ncbi:hypothetical protein FACS1894193_02430 [Bacilli bacterium]|nr:hypothetical protein FACS1894192_10480 [Bacilli bacterium]GHU40335.1 hypothetical protein FACS1894193_02430 [Bacilli bacterium]